MKAENQPTNKQKRTRKKKQEITKKNKKKE